MLIYFIKKYFLLVSIRVKKEHSNVWGFQFLFLIYSKIDSRFKIFYKSQLTIQCTAGILMNIGTHVYADNKKVIFTMTTHNVISKYSYYLHNIFVLNCNSANINLNNQKDSYVQQKLNLLSAFLIGEEHKTSLLL